MKTKKNVLHLVEYLYLGGIERLLEQLALNSKNLANNHFFSYETKSLDGIGKEIMELGFPVFTFKKSQGRDWALVFELIRIIKEQKIEVLHTHDFGPVEYAVLLKLRFPRLKLIHTQHTVIHFVRHRKYTRFFQLASFFYYKIIAVSSFTAETIKEHCPLMKRSALLVISNGVDTKLFKPKQKKITDNVLRLVSVARISKEKNLNYLIHTCKLLKENNIPFVFHHAGEGKLPEQMLELKKNIEDNKLQNEVFLHGFTSDVSKILELGEMFVSASHTEGHPVSVLEAMASEKICFCSDIPPHVELGGSVNLFNKDQEDSLFLMLKEQYLKAQNIDDLEKGKMARLSVESRYSIEKMVENYVTLY